MRMRRRSRAECNPVRLFGQVNGIREYGTRISGLLDVYVSPRFGSEMAWDSTGQEGIYAWSKYFGNNATAANALNAILAYQPLIAHWGYNGNARRYW
jgi:hypothetical protein